MKLSPLVHNDLCIPSIMITIRDYTFGNNTAVSHSCPCTDTGLFLKGYPAQAARQYNHTTIQNMPPLTSWFRFFSHPAWWYTLCECYLAALDVCTCVFQVPVATFSENVRALPFFCHHIKNQERIHQLFL